VDSDRNGIVDYWDGLFAVGPRRAKVLVGRSRRFCAIGGRPPYTWSSSNTAVGSIAPYTVEFKAGSPGATIVTVTDAEGRSARDPVVLTVVDVADTPPDIPLLVMPLDGSSGQDTSLVLVWAGSDPDGDAFTYDVYFGETAQLDSTNLVLKDYFWADCSVEGLRPETTYYWKIVASDGQSRVAGPVWSFGTKFRYKLRLAGYNIDDVSGDNDGKLDPGETIKLTVRLRNFGRDVSNLSVFPNSDDPVVSIISDSAAKRSGIWRSEDGGQTWELRDNGIEGRGIYGLEVNPADHNILYACGGGGVYKSSDGGLRWSKLLEFGCCMAIAISEVDPNVL